MGNGERHRRWMLPCQCKHEGQGAVLEIRLSVISAAMVITVMIFGGCDSNSHRVETKAEFVREGEEHFFVVCENGVEVAREFLSDGNIFKAELETPVDFDGDGNNEYIVSTWEGQNSGDWVLIVGKSRGIWSVWHSFLRHEFTSRIWQDEAGVWTVETPPGKHSGLAQKWRFINDRFVEQSAL